MLIDVLSLITPNAAGLGNNYLQDTSSGGTPTITYVGSPDENGVFDLVYMKGLGGDPWDWMKVGQGYIRQLLTENVWSQYNTGKLASAVTLGARRFPRWIDYTYPSPSVAAAPSIVSGLSASISSPTVSPTPGQWQFTLQRPETDYVIYTSTDTTNSTYGIPTSRNTNNYVRVSFAGPFPGAATVDLPAGEDWIMSYERGGSLVNGAIVYQGAMEQLFHRSVRKTDGSRAGYGRYAWKQFAWVNGAYSTTPNASSLANKIIALPTTPIIPKQMVF